MSEFAMEKIVHNAWYICAWSDELDDKPLARIILCEDLVIYRERNGTVRVLEDRCCHRGVRLSLGSVEKDGIMCGYHGLVYDGSGRCVDNPGEKKTHSFRVRSYPTVERQKFIWVWTGDPELADEDLIIDFPYHDDFSFHYTRYDISANFMFMIDNLMDLTHLGYVHSSTIGGDPTGNNEAELTTTSTQNGAHFLRWMMDASPPPSFAKAVDLKGLVDRWSDFEYIAPASVLQWGGVLPSGCGAKENRHQQGGLSLRLFHHATPQTEDTFHYFFSATIEGLDKETNASKGFYKDILEAFLEDKLFLESQQEAVTKAPNRPLMLREHDQAVAYSRRAIHRLQDAELKATAAE